MVSPHTDPILSGDILSRVLTRLCPGEVIRADLDGLRSIYSGWCRRVPFDNIRKVTDLFEGAGKPLPGGDAIDFFEHWLEHGSGGTCWPSSNALYTLLQSIGFNPRRVAGSMWDLDELNHGTVKVSLEATDWLLDTWILSMHPLPLLEKVCIFEDAGIKVEIEKVADTHRVWTDTPPLQDYVPCRLRDDDVSLALYLDRYEESRLASPFNKKLYLRYRDTERPVVYSGNVSYRRTADGGVSARVLSREELCDSLRDEIGISPGLIERWANSGGLDLNFARSEERDLPKVADIRPSMRIGAARSI